ncbi:hypothetical protein ACTHRH_17695 [Paenibacillus sp. SAFN-117]|uniref:hypothetical protein n=1 Tax=Paenibacillus sp. 32O-W TaxID=1695218 RepID=UPI001C92BA2E|nr:hypothetical protein [Paenibacillus sp. 32O-W]
MVTSAFFFCSFRHAGGDSFELKSNGQFFDEEDAKSQWSGKKKDKLAKQAAMQKK